MPFDARVYRILIASPGDLSEEREVIPNAIHQWNASHSASKKAVLLPVKWETHAAPEIAGRPQQSINTQLVQHCDLLIGMFWTRIGSPTGVEVSGTVEEIKQFIDSNRRVMLYFSNKPVVMASVNLDQYKGLQDFKKWIQDKGIYSEFSDSTELYNKVLNHLTSAMDSILGALPDIPPVANQPVARSDTNDDQANRKIIRDLIRGEIEQNVQLMQDLQNQVFGANNRAKVPFVDVALPNWPRDVWRSQMVNASMAIGQEGTAIIQEVYRLLDNLGAFQVSDRSFDERIKNYDEKLRDARSRGFHTGQDSYSVGLTNAREEVRKEKGRNWLNLMETLKRVDTLWMKYKNLRFKD